MTVARVKQLLNITVTTYDAYIVAVLSARIEALQQELNIEFEEDEESGDLTVPAPLQLVVAFDVKNGLAEIRDVQSKSLGDFSISYDAVANINDRNRIANSFRSVGGY